MAMDFKRLRSFITVAEELHYGRAAERLHIVQPALSQHIRQLEDELGVCLLERSSRRVALTEAGRLCLAEARLAMQHLDLAAMVAREAGQGMAGTLHIGFVDNAVWSVLPDIVRAFRVAFKAIEVSLTQMARVPQADALLSGIMPGPVSRPGLSAIPLVRTPLHVALPPQHRLAAMEEVPIAELAAEPFITFASVADKRRIDEVILSICAQAGFTPTLAQAVDQMHTALALVSTGLGVAVVPGWMRRAWQDNIVYRPLTPHSFYGLMMVSSTIRSRPAIGFFGDVAARVIGQPRDTQDEWDQGRATDLAP
jgi:DNA-binding transcriptional LysR family regulator